MKRTITVVLLNVVLFATTLPTFAQKGGEIVKPRHYKPLNLVKDTDVSDLTEFWVSVETLNMGFKKEDAAATVIDLSDPKKYTIASYNGDRQFYTASVVKMFYMAALARQLEDGKIKLTPELERGEKDMIVDSSNEATQYVLDVLTDTSSGAELPAKQFDAWQYKRNRVNRWLTSMGYTNININQKTFCEDAYGIEQQSRNYKGQNRNMLTTDATARMLAEIVTYNIALPRGTEHMMNLMARDPFTKKGGEQGSEFIGKALVDLDLKNAKLWSKAGWTSKVRHDAAYIDFGNGQKIVVVIFTENNANNKNIIPEIAKSIIKAHSGK
ncbi:MAG TPA: serine hydrolase [Pyrinomonadaceae bacterium]|nr:serine hydrolase [Pyrinomonadaceae bacterium]